MLRIESCPGSRLTKPAAGGARRYTVIDVAQPVIDYEAHVRSRVADAWMVLRTAGKSVRAVMDDNDYPAFINPEET
jgi:hypothetical protein